jgi:hypothetical protein
MHAYVFTSGPLRKRLNPVEDSSHVRREVLGRGIRRLGSMDLEGAADGTNVTERPEDVETRHAANRVAQLCRVDPSTRTLGGERSFGWRP